MADSQEPMDIDPQAAPSDAKAKSKTGKDASGKKRFEVKKWNAVALWAWDIVVDNCAICRNHIMDLCQPSLSYERRVHCGMGYLQPCFPFSLHLSLAQDSTGLPIGQQRVGIPKVRTIVDLTTLQWLTRESKNKALLYHNRLYTKSSRMLPAAIVDDTVDFCTRLVDDAEVLSFPLFLRFSFWFFFANSFFSLDDNRFLGKAISAVSEGRCLSLSNLCPDSGPLTLT